MSIGDVSHKTELDIAGSEVETDSICVEDVSQKSIRIVGVEVKKMIEYCLWYHIP